jgi:hypothetical protein
VPFQQLVDPVRAAAPGPQQEEWGASAHSLEECVWVAVHGCGP